MLGSFGYDFDESQVWPRERGIRLVSMSRQTTHHLAIDARTKLSVRKDSPHLYHVACEKQLALLPGFPFS